MDAAVAAAIATIIATGITALAGRATSRAAARSAVRSAQVTSLADLEREAGVRMAGYYTDTINDLRSSRADDRAEWEKKDAESQRKIAGLEQQVEALKEEVNRCLAKCKRLELRGDGDSSIGP